MTQVADARSTTPSSVPKFVFGFSQGDKDQKDLLGGKGGLSTNGVTGCR
jgi:hypothetical protein